MPDEAYLEFLDRRIPELQRMGKPATPPGLDTLGKQVRWLVRIAPLGEFRGRDARTQADREWADLKRRGEV